MLRSALDAYLSGLKERELDAPFLLLLRSMGFYDVHLTHGAVEFGKDFIAKKIEGGQVVQYSFQNKVGNINQKDFRDDILGQLRESLYVPLSHANFDHALPHQAVLVTTGDLVGNAGIALDSFNGALVADGRRPVKFWSESNLIDLFIDFGLGGVAHATASQFEEFGSFFVHYGRALQDRLPASEIEPYSRAWLTPASDLNRQLLRSALEAEILDKALLSNEREYESVVVRLAVVRVLCRVSYEATPGQLASAYHQALSGLHLAAMRYLEGFRSVWEPTQDLVGTGHVSLVQYLVHCSRVMEIAGIAYFSTDDANTRQHIADFLASFCTVELGTGHPLSDRYAVALVVACLALRDAGKTDIVFDLIRRATVWLCDRFDKGMGLAGLEASEPDEVSVLLGYPFDFVQIERSPGSFLATALCDLAAILIGESLYDDVINDIKASRINPRCVQPTDSPGACEVSASDVIQFPTIQYVDELSKVPTGCYANYLETELSEFRFVAEFGPSTIVALMALLRDRYFPLVWPLIVPGIEIPC
jgi:hypothetical protein